MVNLQGKRLLILGGSLWKDAIKKAADEFGVTLVAAGNNMSASIFQIAHETYCIDSTNPEMLVDLIRDKKIDGVYMGGSETVISSVCAVLNKIGMPCYCTHEQWDLMQNKSKFKDLCIKNNLPVVPKFKFEEVKQSDFPVITKPVDGSGSRGFSICYNQEELAAGYEASEKVSPTGSVIIEKYVKNDGVVVFYTVSNGKLHFSGLEDKYPVRYQGEGSYVGGLFVFESRYAEEFRQKFEDKIQNMISSIGIREGTFWIEVFMDNGKFYFNEVGYRYGGSASVYPVNYLYGINQVAMDMYYALTGESLTEQFTSMISDGVPDKKFYAVYPVYADAGSITEIIGYDEIIKRENIVVFPIVKKEGNTISTGTFAQVTALAHIVFDSVEELKETISFVHEHFKIIDKNKNNIVTKILNIEELVLKNAQKG